MACASVGGQAPPSIDVTGRRGVAAPAGLPPTLRRGSPRTHDGNSVRLCPPAPQSHRVAHPPLSSMTAEDEAWTPLGSGEFGAELRGAAASALVARLRAGHAPTRALLRSRLARHGVLALRPDAAEHSGDGDTDLLLDVATQLGRPRLLPRTTWVSADGSSRAQQGEVAAAPSVLRVIRNAEDTAGPIFGEQWHRDGSFCDQPPQATLWQAVEIPPVRGGRTRFASMDALYHGLPPSCSAATRCTAQ